jgi:hypothetical protein
VNALERDLVRHVIRCRLNGYGPGEAQALKKLRRVMGPERADRELARIAAPSARPAAPKSAAKRKPPHRLHAARPAPKPDDLDDDDNTLDPEASAAAAAMPKLRHIDPCFDAGPAPLFMARPTALERARADVARAAGMPDDVARTLTDAHLCGLAPAFGAMTKGSSR